MTVRPVLSMAVATLALAALTACTSTETPPPPPPAGAPSAAAPAAPGAPGAPATDAQKVATAHQGAGGLAALGALGQEKGSTSQIQTLAGQIAADSKALDEQLRAIAGASGVTLSDEMGVDEQAVLADLQARSGAQFDQLWIRAVLDQQQKLRTSAEAVLNSPNASAEAKAAARDILARLDAAAAKLSQASGASGAATPGSVNSGNGGQAADGGGLPLVALGLLGGGAVLLGAAVRSGRAARR